MQYKNSCKILNKLEMIDFDFENSSIFEFSSNHPAHLSYKKKIDKIFPSQWKKEGGWNARIFSQAQCYEIQNSNFLLYRPTDANII